MSPTSHQKRIITALILIPLLGLVIYTGDLALTITLALAGVLGLWEFYGLFWTGRNRLLLKAIGVLGGLLFIVDSGLDWSRNPVLFLILFFWVLWLLFLTEYSRKKEEAGFRDYLVIIAGMLYIPLVLSLFINLSARETVFVLLAAAASDTGAYYAGSWWGGRRIWPEVSPKKTWAGSLGGLLLCTAVTLSYGQVLGQGGWPQYLVLGLLVNVAAQLGDFFQSSLKRWAQVKDSGNILPGHGGILDRMDSILFLLPIYVLFNLIFKVF